jgi:tRNA (guanine10-N2)-dimethyltransferase
MYAVLLKGHYPDIALEEVRTLANTYGSNVLSVDERVVIIDRPFRFERLAFSHLAIKVLGEGSVEDLLRSAEHIETESFAVRGPMNLSAKLGAKIKGRVDLEHPEVVFRILKGRKYYFGETVWVQNKKGFVQRFMRVYYHPTNLKPELARVLVNLTGVKEGERSIDPFCGTGSILIEAADMGIRAVGIDIDEKMVEGCKENLEHLGYNAEVIHGDAFELVNKLKGTFNALATDIPYGRSSTLSGKKKDEFLEKLPRILEFLEMGRAVIMSDISLNFRGKVAEFKIRVHGSLTRYVNIFEV